MKLPIFLLLVLIPLCLFGKKIARILPHREPLPRPVSEIISISDVKDPGFEIVEPRGKGNGTSGGGLEFEIVKTEELSR